MNERAITRYLTDTFPDTQVVVNDGSSFFFIGSERHFPFATLVTTNEHDAFSGLDRPGVFRLNFGLSKTTFLSLFGSPVGDEPEGSRDYTVLDQVLPHPVYGQMYWACILCPTFATFQHRVRALLLEAHDLNAQKVAKRAGA